MKIFQAQMGKAKSLPKAKLYPCLLALCDEQIADLSTRVTMLANPDTAYRVDAQGKGGSGGGSGGSGGGSRRWAVVWPRSAAAAAVAAETAAAAALLFAAVIR
jgi:hypothetical protein